jgi:hypothetical protein
MKKFYLFFTVLLFCNLLSAQNDIIVSIDAPSNLQRVLIQGTDYYSTRNTLFSNNWARGLTIGEKITADVVVYRDTSRVDTVAQHGCLVTPKVGVDVKGKIALFRRGTCAFSDKAYAAWKNGAVAVVIYDNRPAGAIGLGPTPPKSDSVAIPVISLTQQFGEGIRNAVQGGTKVTMTFTRPVLNTPIAAYNYNTPVKEAIGLEDFIIGFVNPTNSTKKDVTFTASVRNPLGAVTNVTSKVDSIRYRGDTTQFFGFPPYQLTKTSPVGRYTVNFKNSLTTDSIATEFNLTNGVFSHDAGRNYSWVTLNAEYFGRAENAYIMDVGNVFLTGKDTTKATHIAFAFNNPDSFPKDEIFKLQLYRLTSANYGKLGDRTLTYNDIKNDLAAEGQYKLRGNKLDKPDSLLFVEFKTPVDLADSSFYIAVVRYDGLFTGLNTKLQAPRWTTAGSTIFPTSSYYIFYYEPSTGGGCSCFVMDPEAFGNNINYVVRLFTRDARITGTKDLPALAENQVKLFPNPVSDNVLNIDFALQNVADVVNIHITDLAGKTISVQKLYNVKDGVQQVQLGNLANGSYFATIVTKEGWRTKVFQVLK